MSTARPFYEKFLPAIGFVHDVTRDDSPWVGFDADGTPPTRPWFNFIEDPDHVPNRNRIAFSAATDAEVDRLAALAVEFGAVNMSGPKLMPQYSEGYYAAFFDDPSGNALEICCCR